MRIDAVASRGRTEILDVARDAVREAARVGNETRAARTWPSARAATHGLAGRGRIGQRRARLDAPRPRVPDPRIPNHRGRGLA